MIAKSRHVFIRTVFTPHIMASCLANTPSAATHTLLTTERSHRMSAHPADAAWSCTYLYVVTQLRTCNIPPMIT